MAILTIKCFTSDAEYHEPRRVSRQRESYFYGGGVEVESTEEDGSVSPPESGSGRESPAPALTSDDRKRDKVNSNGWSIGTMNVAGCSGDTRLMMPSLQHIVTTRIHLYILFNLPLSSICKVKSSGLLLNGICLSPICYANVPLSPLIRPSSQQLDISRYR